jgi:hypothetical protein
LSRFYVDAAEIFSKAQDIGPAILIQARLFPDMLPFVGQIRRASDTYKTGMGQLTGFETLRWSDSEADCGWRHASKLLFHVTMAHDILRFNGVEVGKCDYLGTIGTA